MKVNSHKKEIVVLKIGSSSITTINEDGVVGLNLELIAKLATGVNSLINANYDVIIVASGAVAAGMYQDKLKVRPTDPFELGELASVGQPILMKLLADEFAKYSKAIAQVLPERASYHDEERRQRMFNIRKKQLEKQRIVFINENDPVVGDELTFGDNDFVAALESIGMNAKYLVLFTDQDGIYSKNPSEHSDATLYEQIDTVDPALFESLGNGNSLGSGGGSYSKIYAADVARHSGVIPIIANANKIDSVLDLIEGRTVSTRFSLVHDTHFSLNFACDILDKIAEQFSDSKNHVDVSKYYRDIDSIARLR